MTQNNGMRVNPWTIEVRVVRSNTNGMHWGWGGTFGKISCCYLESMDRISGVFDRLHMTVTIDVGVSSVGHTMSILSFMLL